MKEKIKNVTLKFSKYLIVYIAMTILFFSLLFISFSLPNERIRYHVTESVPALEQDPYLIDIQIH